MFNRITFPAFLLIPGLRLLPYYFKKYRPPVLSLSFKTITNMKQPSFFPRDRHRRTLHHRPSHRSRYRILHPTLDHLVRSHPQPGAHPSQQPHLQPRPRESSQTWPSPLVPAHPGQPPPAPRPRSPPPLHPAPALPSPIFRHFWNRGAVHLPTPRSPLPPPHGPPNPLLGPPPQKREAHPHLDRIMDHLQLHLWRPYGNVPPRRSNPRPGIFIKTTRRHPGSMVENLFPPHLALEWKKRSPNDKRCDGAGRG